MFRSPSLSRWLACGLAALALSAATRAHALSVQATLDEYTGTDSSLQVLIEEIAAGDLRFTLTITKPVAPTSSEIRGFFSHISNESLLAGLSIAANPLVTAFVKSANNVNEAGGSDNKVNGGGGPGLLDFGIAFGTSGQDNPNIGTVTFVMSHSTQDLTASLFDGQLMAARLKPLPNDGSSKNKGYGKLVNVPDQGSTWALLGAALAGVATLRRRSAKA